MEELLNELNPRQREAVEQAEGPCLVIAGAGSGKTKVLTYKISYLMQVKGVKPWNILAITFTNKAANEMKERVERLASDAINDIWLGTFHSICVRILRKYIDRLGFDHSFLIFDTSDQRTLIKECMKALKEGKKLYIFPEGTRLKDESKILGEIKSGLAMIAIKTKTPILTVWHERKPKAFRRSNIYIGKPYELTEFYGKKLDEETLNEANNVVREKMLEVYHEIQEKKVKK